MLITHKPTRYKSIGLLSALAMVNATTSAHAQTIAFSNLGSRPSLYGIGFTETGPFSHFGLTYSQGEAFSPTVSGSLSSMNVALLGSGDAHFYLADGIPGVLDTKILESFTLTTLPANAYSVLTSISHPVLTTGDTYYLYELETGNEFNSWAVNRIGEIGTHITSENGAPYIATDGINQAAFDVEVTPVPEASTTISFGLLMTLGLGGMIIAAKKRKARITV